MRQVELDIVVNLSLVFRNEINLKAASGTFLLSQKISLQIDDYRTRSHFKKKKSSWKTTSELDLKAVQETRLPQLKISMTRFAVSGRMPESINLNPSDSSILARACNPAQYIPADERKRLKMKIRGRQSERLLIMRRAQGKPINQWRTATYAAKRYKSFKPRTIPVLFKQGFWYSREINSLCGAEYE